MKEKRPRQFSWWKILILLSLAGGIICIFVYSRIWNDTLLYNLLFHLKKSMVAGARLREEILAYGAMAPLLFIILQLLQVLFAPIPGEASGFLGGYLFGAWPGFLYSSIGLTLGSVLAFGIGRLLGDALITRFRKRQVYRKFNHIVRKSDFAIPFVLFLLPGFPKDALSYLLGLSSMPLRIFIFIACVARMPGTLMLSFQGAQVYQGNFLQLLVLLVSSAAVALPCIFYRKQILARLSLYNRHSSLNNQED